MLNVMLISLLVFKYPAIYFFIYFSIGDSRSCASAFFPGNDYVDKLEREKQIFFIVEESEFSEFVQFDRDSAWCFLADDDRKDNYYTYNRRIPYYIPCLTPPQSLLLALLSLPIRHWKMEDLFKSVLSCVKAASIVP